MIEFPGFSGEKHLSSHKKPVILVVDKEKAICELIQEMLSASGFEVDSAADALEALSLASSKDHPIDLLLTETDTNGMRVPEAINLLYKKNPRMKVLFMSGKFDEELAFMLGDHAHRLFLLKPFTQRTLLQKIDDVLC